MEKPNKPGEITLRPYQQECVDLINSLDGGSHLIAIGTGLGKTVIFSHIERKGRMLILSHRDELVHQPKKYFDCSFGIEKAAERSNGEEVVSASVQSLVRRLDKFDPNDFDTIITDEAHHAAAKSYRKIYDYFNFRLHLGFTATPNRGDKVRLDDIFDDIIFQRDMRWGIENKYLSDIRCVQVDIGYDVSKVRRRMGDYNPEQLAEAVNISKANAGIAKAYKKLAKGQTMIFAASVAHAVAISKLIKKSAVVTAATEDRDKIIEKFRCGKIRCLVNCMIFTEGTDLPMIQTVICARPTENASLYTQMVGRGTRLYPGKDYLTLIDCVGYTGSHSLCTAATLFGLDASKVPKKKKKQLEDIMLTDMEDTIETLMDIPDAWILNTNEVDVFAENNSFDLHGIYWRTRADGAFICNLGNYRRLILTPMDELGCCSVYRQSGRKEPVQMAHNIRFQEALDRSYAFVNNYFDDTRKLWDKNLTNEWGVQPASDKQKRFVEKLLHDPRCIEKYGEPTLDIESLTKYQASVVIDKLFENYGYSSEKEKMENSEGDSEK